jgi:hypothetical protein
VLFRPGQSFHFSFLVLLRNLSGIYYVIALSWLTPFFPMYHTNDPSDVLNRWSSLYCRWHSMIWGTYWVFMETVGMLLHVRPSILPVFWPAVRSPDGWAECTAASCVITITALTGTNDGLAECPTPQGKLTLPSWSHRNIIRMDKSLSSQNINLNGIVQSSCSHFYALDCLSLVHLSQSIPTVSSGQTNAR